MVCKHGRYPVVSNRRGYFRPERDSVVEWQNIKRGKTGLLMNEVFLRDGEAERGDGEEGRDVARLAARGESA